MATPAEQSGLDSTNPIHQPKCPPDHYHDDMNDHHDLACLEREIAAGNSACEPFYNALKIIQAAIYRPYLGFDREAVRNQRWYTFVSIAAVFAGALSVFFAVMELIDWAEDKHFVAWTAELLFTSVTLGVIAWGTMHEFKDNWILARYKAERLRLLKFERLTDPSLWCDPIDLAGAEEILKDEVRRIGDEGSVASECWAEHGIHPTVRTPPCEDRCQEALRRLVHYYIPKRLDVQTKYLERKSKSVEGSGARTSRIVRWIFFASFAFVMVHLVLSYPAKSSEKADHPATSQGASANDQSQDKVEWTLPDPSRDSATNKPSPELGGAANPKPDPSGSTKTDARQPTADTSKVAAVRPSSGGQGFWQTTKLWILYWRARAHGFFSGMKNHFSWGDVFAVLALFLPIVAGAFRTHRAAHEFERTAARHKSTCDSLVWLRKELHKTNDEAKQFELIGFCELVLEADCREFIRLVSETEWYG